MEFNNWKSFLSKSILAPLLVIAILLYQKFLLNVNEDLNSLIFGGTIFVYGLCLIAWKIYIKDRYNYILIFGLLYSLIGSVSIFFFTLYEKYLNTFIYIISLLYLFHAFCKIFIRTLRNKIIRIMDIILGAIWIVLVVLSVYSLMKNNANVKEIVYICGFVISVLELILGIFRLVFYYKENAHIIKEIRITNRATPKKDKDNTEANNSNQKKKMKKEGKVEVIDLERFFKE